MSLALLHAKDWYVAPTGSPAGNGSISSPWDFHTGIQAISVVKPGDNIWVRGGKYTYSSPWMFEVNLSGTAAAPIIIRNYPGEWPVIDLGNNGDEFVMDHAGRVIGTNSSGGTVTAWNNSDYVWLWGLEITATGIPRSTSVSGSFGIGNIVDIAIYGVGVKVINCYIHDMHGVGFWSTSTGAEINGTLIGNMGWNGPDRGHGHNLYVQNDGSGTTKQINNVFLYNSFDIGMQWYGSGAALVQNIAANGVTIVNAGSPIGVGAGQLVIADGGQSKKNLVYKNGFIYSNPAFASAFSEIGWVFDGINQNVDVENNFFANQLALEHWSQLTFLNNTVKGQITLENYDGVSPAQSTSGWSLNGNTYAAGTTFVLGSSHLNSSGSPVTSDNYMNFSQWKGSLPGQETTSTSNVTLPLKVVVQPNAYEAGRANIVIYNPLAAATVAVDLSQVTGLNNGDAWQLQDALNFRGNPVLTGVYSSASSTIQVPMTGLTPAPVLGWGAPVPHTAPYFAEFVIFKSQPSTSSDTTPPTASITSPLPGTVSATVTVAATANDNVGVTSVQFQLDGANLGSQVTAPPYSISWNTTGASNGAHSLSAIAFDAAGNRGTAAPVAITVSNTVTPPPGGGTGGATGGGATGGTATASFVKTDTTTQGSWKGNYGSDGYSIVNNATSYPSYAQVTVQGASQWTWNSAAPDARALSSAIASTRIASAWYSAGSFSLDVNLTDGKPHVVSIYCLDYDSTTRGETVKVMDASTSAVLDQRTLTSFAGGVWVVWNISGHATIQITRTSGSNGVVSGLFFGTPTPATVTYMGTDTTTLGSWKGIYGNDGEIIAGDGNNPASYAKVTFTGQSNWTWALPSSDIRSLQQSAGSSRVAATWYTGTSYTIDVNLTDGQAHSISLYCLDYDSTSRGQQISIVDGNNGNPLDTRALTGFHGGDYLTWTVSGHVTFQITRTAGSNAVVSGLFFH